MQPHRSSALGYASAASAVHSRVYRACTAEAAASESLGLSVGGCPRARRYFGPYPVPYTRSKRTRARGAVRKAGMKSGPKKIQEKKSLSNRYNINKRIDTHDCHWRGGSAHMDATLRLQ